MPDCDPEARRKEILAATKVIDAHATQRLIDGLRDEDPINREWSVEGLLRRKDRRKAVRGLVDRLRDDRADVRWYAARAIGKLGLATAEIVEGLTAALHDPDLYVRAFAACALGELRVTEATPQLRARLRELGIKRRGLEEQSVGMALARIDTEPGEKSSPKQGSLFGDDVLSPLRPDELPKTKGQILKEELLRMAKAVYLDRGGNDLVLRGTARFAVQYARRNALKQAVITMRGPTCQLCGFTFRKKSGQFFAESHHIDPVSEGGRDDEPYLLVICANHHRQLHYAEVTWPKGKKRPREVSINGEVLPIRWTEAEPEGA